MRPRAIGAICAAVPIGFRIAARGGADAVVDEVHLTGDAGMGNIAFEGCVLPVMSSLRFDAPPEGVILVTYPLTFSNDGAPRE